MGLNIKNPGVEADIRKLAAHTGESLTDAIANAVREKLTRVEEEAARSRPAQTVEEFLARIKPLQDEIAEYKRKHGIAGNLREIADEEDYDENGLPR